MDFEISLQQKLAQKLHDLHHLEQPLLLTNVWDALSAKIVEQSGATAIATSSASLSWAAGYPDGEVIPAGEMIEAVYRIARTVEIPVTADIEGGFYWDDLGNFQNFIAEIIKAGAVGFNLEDSGKGFKGLYPLEKQIEKIRLAKEVAQKLEIPIYLNARVDTMTLPGGKVKEKIEETVQRALAYQQAGADGIFVPFITDMEVIRQLKPRIPLPLNIMANRFLKIEDLKEIGVERISTGARPAMAVYNHLAELTKQIQTSDDWSAINKGQITYETINNWLSKEI